MQTKVIAVLMQSIFMSHVCHLTVIRLYKTPFIKLVSVGVHAFQCFRRRCQPAKPRLRSAKFAEPRFIILSVGQ